MSSLDIGDIIVSVPVHKLIHYSSMQVNSFQAGVIAQAHHGFLACRIELTELKRVFGYAVTV